MTVNCPYCGSEVRENEKFCQSCGAAMDPNRAPAQQSAVPAAGPKNYKEFVQSALCSPDVNKNIRASWILLLVCAALSLAVALINKSLPIDALLIAAVAVWLMLSKSFPAGLTACIVGVLELVLTSISMGRLSGYFPAIAGIYALAATLKGRKEYKAYREKG